MQIQFQIVTKIGRCINKLSFFLCDFRKFLNFFYDAFGSNSEFFEENHWWTRSWDLSYAHLSHQNVACFSDSIEDSISNTTLRVMVFYYNNLSITFSSILQDSFLVNGLDGKWVHYSNFEPQSFKFWISFHSLI